MDLFRTPIKIESTPFITHRHRIVTLGSCFAETIGSRLLRYKWAGLANPFGTLFHPFAIFKQLSPDSALDRDLFLHQTSYTTHFHLPKTFFAQDQQALQTRWTVTQKSVQECLAAPQSVLLLTLGTAFIYNREGNWVANCHQEPAKHFTKELSSVESMLQVWKTVFTALPKSCQIIVTVSPVRHAKDGLVPNSLSKSLLRILAEEMVKLAPQRIHYFPAFEIMMDDLRDYRFYQRDRLHPNDEAINYIAEQFEAAYLTVEAKASVAKWRKILDRLGHRP